MEKSRNIKLAIVDDHKLFRRGLRRLIEEWDKDIQVTLEAENGLQLIEQWESINDEDFPDLVLLDIQMPQMDGFEIANWIVQNHSKTKIIVLTMFTDDVSIIRMTKIGASAYLLKNVEPEELMGAIHEVINSGSYYSKYSTDRLINNLRNPQEPTEIDLLYSLTPREIEFLKLLASELTYKEIADRMMLSSRTVDGYRDSLFHKLGVFSRVGLVISSIRLGLVSV
jgi:two-component system invasion response regulator UvrY